jgi:rubrerythrin
MDQLIRAQNIARYRRLLEHVTEESVRQTIFNLLAEEQQKQKDAGDPINLSRNQI